MDFHKLQSAVIQFRNDRDWKQFHNPKDLSNAISIEASELMAHFLRKTQKESYDLVNDNTDIEDEFADIFNTLILFADATGIDIEKAVLNKIKKNNRKYPVEKARGKSDKYNKL